MKVRVDKSACAGHALCYGVDAELFPLDGDGYSALEPRDEQPADEQRVRNGVASCPERALFLDDDR
jgi:ferredoxin